MGKQADGVRAAGTALLALAWFAALVGSGFLAYDIRMYAINTYGRVIHEFDPWFNYRATEYLGEKVVWNGWYQGLLDFFHWCAATPRRRCSAPLAESRVGARARAGTTTSPGTRWAGQSAPPSTPGCRSRPCGSGGCSAGRRRAGASA